MATMPMDCVDFIMDFETGQCSPEQIVRGFGNLVQSGLAWQLQGCYGRQAKALIEAGYLDDQGNVLRLPEEE